MLAKIGVDTAENEPLKIHWIFKRWDLIFADPPRPNWLRAHLVPGGAVVAVGYGAELRRLLPELEGLKADGLEESRAPRKGIFDSREDVIIDLFDKLLSFKFDNVLNKYW